MRVVQGTVLAAVFASGAPLQSGAPPQRDAPEYEVKAAILSKLPRFTEWPPEAARADRIILCVARPNPFGEVLRDLIINEQVHGKPLAVRELSTPDLSTCHVLFLPSDAAAGRRNFLTAARDTPLLTVGDYPEFIAEGGVVNLRVVEGRVRFEVSLDAARRSRLRLDSQLLRIAFRVHGAPA